MLRKSTKLNILKHVVYNRKGFFFLFCLQGRLLYNTPQCCWSLNSDCAEVFTLHKSNYDSGSGDNSKDDADGDNDD